MLQKEDFAHEDKILAWTNQLQARLLTANNKTQSFTVEVMPASPEGHYVPRVTITQHGVGHDIILNIELVLSKDYKEMVQLGRQLHDLVEEGAIIKRGDKSLAIDSFDQALQWLMEEAKRGQTIQRYKGLGEMNPSQLWETTMDPAVRRMLQVKIEDAVAADEIFTTLMGDVVEPRRAFIEDNALSAGNIDI